jgi:hypothetical protein
LHGQWDPERTQGFLSTHYIRLSLANGSDQLLERLICVLPKEPDQPWHSMNDAYGAKASFTSS